MLELHTEGLLLFVPLVDLIKMPSKRGSWLTKRKRKAGGKEVHWQLPYLPLDPEDIGRTYEAIIRVNSQSGKGGSAWVILRNLELDLPRGLQIAFSKVVQARAEVKGQELTNEELCELFKQEYFIDYDDEAPEQYFKLVDYSISTPSKGIKEIQADIEVDGKVISIKGEGNGQLSAFNNAIAKYLNIDIDVKHYHEHSLGEDSKARAATYIEVLVDKKLQDGVWVFILMFLKLHSYL